MTRRVRRDVGDLGLRDLGILSSEKSGSFRESIVLHHVSDSRNKEELSVRCDEALQITSGILLGVLPESQVIIMAYNICLDHEWPPNDEVKAVRYFRLRIVLDWLYSSESGASWDVKAIFNLSYTAKVAIKLLDRLGNNA